MDVTLACKDEQSQAHKEHLLCLLTLQSAVLNAEPDVDVETILVSRKVSGRFRCGKLLRHFSPIVSGLCELCEEEIEDISHSISMFLPER